MILEYLLCQPHNIEIEQRTTLHFVELEIEKKEKIKMKLKSLKTIGLMVCALALTITFISKAAHADARVQVFEDVSPSDSYYPYVMELVEKGVINPSEKTFDPEQPITRAQAAALALKAMPIDTELKRVYGEEKLAKLMEIAVDMNGEDYWANPYVIRTAATGVLEWDGEKDLWEQYATRGEAARIAVRIYSYLSDWQTETIDSEVINLIGDYDSAVENCDQSMEICWLYSKGINEKGDFNPNVNMTRADFCVMLAKLITPDRWKEFSGESYGTYDDDGFYYEKDFAGKDRVRFDEDVAFDYCRALEQQIGIQIFYVPGEWTAKEAGLISVSDIAPMITDEAQYFKDVLAELQKMKAAYDLYPDGLLKEVAERASHGTEIIVCPYTTTPGVRSYGVFVYDYSDDTNKIDQIFYTGKGDSQYYSHEMGHMVMSRAASLNGRDKTVKAWESHKSVTSYVSGYAMQSQAEDWAETWAYGWHQPDVLASACRDSGMKSKVQLMNEMLENYKAFDVSKTPWSGVA